MRILLTIILLGSSVLLAQDKNFYFVFLNTNPDREQLSKPQVDSIQNLHMNNIGRLAKEEKLWAAGPLEGGGGIYIFNAVDQEQTAGWVNTDPAVQANRFNVEIFPYRPMVGSVCRVGEEYEMTTYSMARYEPYYNKENVRAAEKLLFQHQEHMAKLRQTGKVVAEGEFGSKDGRLLVYNDEGLKDLIAKDPAVGAGFMQVTYKKLWIARGSFCEE